jgi:DNA-binding MarR family transcriptional regulator
MNVYLTHHVYPAYEVFSTYGCARVRLVARRTSAFEYEQMLLHRHSMSTYASHDRLLERSAYVLLSRIQVDGPLSIGELSEAFGLDVSTVNRQTAAAVKSGLLRRIPDPGGGLARKFALTDEGNETLDHQRERLRASLDSVMEEWSDDDIAAFAAFLRRFNTDIERRTGRPWPRP